MVASTQIVIPRLLGVVGAGQMGAGIAQVAAVSGLHVVLADLSGQALDRGRAGILNSLARQVKKQVLTEEAADLAMQRISTVRNLQVSTYHVLT